MYHIKIKLLTSAVLLIISFIGCQKESVRNEWKSVNAELETLYTIGNADSSYYFTHPDYAVTTSNNKLVIADRGLNKLMVFDEEGNYLDDIGSKGPGPGEFRDIKSLWVNDKDQIIAFDRNTQSFKQFADSGNHLRSYTSTVLNISTDIKGDYVVNLPILFFRSPMNESSEQYLLHLYSTDYDSIITSSFSPQLLDGYNNMMINLLGRDIGSQLVIDNSILFSPSLYNGYIYKYEVSADSSVTLTKKIKGLTYKEPFTEIDKDADYYDIRLSGVKGEHKFYLHNQTLGLYQLKDGRIVHFTYIENEAGNARTFGAEIYSSEMEPIGYTEFYSKKFENVVQSRLIGKMIRAKDSNDRFYLHDWTGDYDKYEVVKLEIDSVATKK